MGQARHLMSRVCLTTHAEVERGKFSLRAGKLFHGKNTWPAQHTMQKTSFIFVTNFISNTKITIKKQN